MEKNKMFLARQGDVLIMQVSNIPKNVKQVPVDKKRGVVLAYGEVTGHAHALEPSSCTLMETDTKERFLSVPSGALLTHEEHATITLPAGNYKIVQQVEYKREFNRVAD